MTNADDSAKQTKRRPNVVIILCDQMRAFEVGCYGHPVVETPNIDRLAATGAMFQTACSNAPLCVPARNCLLSGQHARTCTGTTTNFCGFPPSRERLVCPDPLLPEVLRDAGYATGLVGKWHLHPAPDVVGFEAGTIVHSHHHHSHQLFYDLRGENGRVVDGWSIDHELDAVQEFVRTHAAEHARPFFLLYSLSPPHPPLDDAPERFLRMYHRDQVQIRDNAYVQGKLAHDRAWFYRYLYDYIGTLPILAEADDWLTDDDFDVRQGQVLPHALLRLLGDLSRLMADPRLGPELRRRLPYANDQRLNDFDLRDLMALYYGNVSMVDDCVGRMLDVLDQQGVAEDTIVVFTSDHGDNLGSHGRWDKGYIFEESIRIPLVFRWPERIDAGRVTSQVGSLIDLMPTLLSLLALPIPDTVQGVDLADVLSSRTAMVHPHTFVEGLFPQIAIRDVGHMFGMEMNGDSEAERRPATAGARHYFFDQTADPMQMHNLVGSGADHDRSEALRSELESWHQSTPRWDIRHQTHRTQRSAV